MESSEYSYAAAGSSSNNNGNNYSNNNNNNNAIVTGSGTGLRAATTIGTIVVRSGPIQMVIALLQSGDRVYVKVVEIEPKLTSLGENIEQAVHLQKQHDELLKQLQGMPTPIDEFGRKADKLLSSKRISADLVGAMADTLIIAWDDILRLLHDRKHLLDLCANFHEKMGSCRGKMASLEVACNDTMIPIEVDAVQDFLNKFKQLRIEMLSNVMSTLKEGNELLAELQKISQLGTLDTRPEHIKRDALRAVHQVQEWLENLHDKRKSLESSWLTRKTQLEQCLALAILAKDLDDVQRILDNSRNHLSCVFHLGECDLTASNSQQEYSKLKHDALVLRDRAIRITVATEKLISSGCFAGDEASQRAYNVLNNCTEYLEMIDQREHWLCQSKEFFIKAGKTLSVLEKLEIELSSVKSPSTNTPESFAMFTKILKDVRAFTEEPLRLGYGILDEVGRTKPETHGVKRVLDEIENRKIYIEGICESSSEEKIKTEQALNMFLEQHNEVLEWLTNISNNFLFENMSMGINLQQSKSFLAIHHQLMQDLEKRGEHINSLLDNIQHILESFDPQQRYDVGTKAKSIYENWIQIKDIIFKRVDLVTILIDFFEKAERLTKLFDRLENELTNKPEEQKLNQLESIWSDIKNAYENLKSVGQQFINSKVADLHLEMKSSCSAVEDTLNSFSNRQLDVTTSLENWTTTIVEKREIEILLEQIMNDNNEIVSKPTIDDANLYPVFGSKSENLEQLKDEINKKLLTIIDDIEESKDELQQRIETTTNIQASDSETKSKIDQVIQNLITLNSKLENIRNEYETFVKNIINYLEKIINLRNIIDNYQKTSNLNNFNNNNNNNKKLQINNLENIINEHDQFRESCMEQFRLLIQQSELLIKRVRILEPPIAQENDTDRILKLLENLRIHFETITSDRMSELEKFKKFNNFQNDLNEIKKNLNSVSGQLNDIHEQNIDSLASAKTTSLAFEYFERTIELLEKRIDEFISSSRNLPSLYPESSELINEELSNLQNDWRKFKEQVKSERNSLNAANEYFSLVEKIDAEYKEISYFLSSVTNKIPYLKEPCEAGNLVNDIENYTSTRQGPLLEKLDKVSQLSKELNNEHKVLKLHLDVTGLFQSFVKLKSDIRVVEDRLKSEDRLREQQAKEEQDRLYEEKIQKEFEQNEQFAKIQYSLPSFIKPLQNKIVAEGQKVIFECEVTGQPIPSIEWFKGCVSIQNNPDYKTTYTNGICTLTIEEVFEADANERFICVASNNVGVAETFGLLSVKESAAEAAMSPPKMVRFLENGIAREGSSFHFSCAVTGNPLPTVQWYKNDKCIDDSRDYVITYNNGEALLEFEEVFLEDDAIYTCNASNPVGFVHCSAKLTVDPLEPTEVPYFRTPLSNVMARVGHKLKLDCTLGGIPKPQIYWTHNGKPLVAAGRDIINYEDDRVTLTIPEAYPKDAGVYILIAKNLAGEAYSSCNVSVKGRLPNETSDSEMASDMEPVKPSVQLTLKDVAIFEGKSVRLDCVIVGQPEPEVIWYHNDQPIKESSDVQLLFQGDRCSLVIREAYLEDGGQYKVVAINSAGEASSSCELKVTPLNIAEPATRMQNSIPNERQAKFDKLLSDVLVAEGDSVELECVASGEQPLIAKWYLTNIELAPSDRIEFYSDPLTGTFKLIFKNVSVDDKGVYTVKVSNQYGEAKCFSHLIVKSVNGVPDNLRVQQMEIDEKHICPTFKELFSNQNAQIGDVVKFECIVKGKPTPKIRWYFNDQPVHGKNFLISTSGDRQVLTIPEANTETIGKIACVAENDIGKATCVGYLALKDPIDIQPSTADVKTMSQEHNTESSRVTIKKQVFTTTSTSQVNTYEGNLPQTEIHTSSAHIDQSLKQLGQQKPVTIEHQYQESHKTNDLPPSLTSTHQKSTVLIQKFDKPSSPKILRKQIPPKFTNELISKIVDQGSNVKLEANYEGFPTPEIHVEKNGEHLFDGENIQITNKLNRITVDIQNVSAHDAGRYSVVAANPVGQSTCTADIVVKKPIFPPVFGHRLQPKIVKPGERAVLEVEVSGTPDPTVNWYKDNKPIKDAGVSSYQLRSSGTTHTLIIDSAKLSDSGRFMVKATNSGGESQNIADFHVIEPQSDKVVEVVKEIVFTDVNDFKQEPLKVEPLSFHKTSTDTSTETERHGVTESKITTEHRCTTEATMRLEHNLAFIDLPTLTRTPQQKSEKQQQETFISAANAIPKTTESLQKHDKIELDHKTVSTNTEKSKMITETTQTPPQVPQKPVPIELSFNKPYEAQSKSAFQCFNKVQVINSLPVETAIRHEALPIDQKYKKFEDVPKLNIDIKTIIPKVNVPSTMDQINLVPGTPPEMCFISQSEYQKTAQLSDKIKKIEETQQKHEQHQQHQQHQQQQQPQQQQQQQQPQQQQQQQQLPKEIPKSNDGPQHLPMTTKEETRSMSSFRKEVRIEYPEPILRPRASLDLSHQIRFNERSLSPKPSAEGIAMEKLWASPKPFEYESCQSDVEYDNKYQVYMSASETEPELLSNSKSINETKKMFEQKIKEHEGVQELKASKPVQQVFSKSIPVPIKINETKNLENLNLQPGSPPEICFAPKPEERRRSLVESMEQTLEKDLLKGPSKVLPHSVPTITPPIRKMVDLSPPKITPSVIKPSTVTYQPIPIVENKKFKPPPPVVPSKIKRNEFYESDYESDRYKYSGSESDEASHRFATRPKSMEIPISPFKSGYVADTEEAAYKKFSTINESRHYFETKDTSSNQTKDTFKQNGFAPSNQSTEYKEFRKSTISKTVSSECKLSSSSQVQKLQKEITTTIPPTPSPSKFVKVELRDTDYSSGYDEKIQPIWQPYDSDSEIKGYRPVRVQFTPTPTKKSNIASEHFQSPANFDRPPSFDGPPRPKFEPIRMEPLPPKAQPQPQLHKPKPLPAKFIATTTPPKQTVPKQTVFYTAVAGAPLHLAKAATETRNTMHMKESSETCQRIVNMEQTKRVIHFDNEKTTSYGIPPDQLPFTSSSSTGRSGTPLRSHNIRPITTPTKFIPGEFKESDYESEVDNAKIRPLWTPRPDYDDPRYRHVDPPQPGRSMSVPRSYERVLSPMQFDQGPQMPSKILVQVPEHRSTQSSTKTSSDRYTSTHKIKNVRTTRDDMNLKVGSPPKYGYIESKATNQVKDFGTSFRQKSHQFIDDLAKDLRTTGTTSKTATPSLRPGFKRAPSEGDNKPQAYRNESRVSQYGTKCVDPNTGLIYFKYDFGYEFGILFPGEGKKFIGGKSMTNNTSNNLINEHQHQRSLPNKNYPLKLPIDGDIIIPVQHEHTSTSKQNFKPTTNNMNANTNTNTNTTTPHHHHHHHELNRQHHQQPQLQQHHHQQQDLRQQSCHSSEMMGYGKTSAMNLTTGFQNINTKNDDGRRQPIQATIDINIDRLHSNDNIAKHFQTVPELPSTIPVNAHLIRDEYPKKPPVFITPVKDIAVVSGQTARFECIVQSDPNTQVIWSKNYVPLEASQKYLIEFRNGVCRLTIPQAYPCDAGCYICTATNEFGSATTTAEFLVPGNNRGSRF